MSTRSIAALLACLVALVSCAAGTYQRVPVPSQEVEVSSSSVARIYVLREREAKGFYRTARVEDNGREIGRIGNDGYLCWEREPGRVLLAIEVEPVDGVGKPVEVLADVQCEAGRVHYYAISVDSAWSEPRVQAMDAAAARELLSELALPPTD